MRSRYTVGTLVVLLMLAASSARATTILSITDALTAADPTQVNRLFRSGTPQDWAGSESFPGTTTVIGPVHYNVYTVNVGITPYIQISYDDPSAFLFVSAYNTTYLPASFSTNWLGDAGFSGNPFGNPGYFQVVMPMNQNLVVVVNEVGSGSGLNQPFGLLVEGFIDTEYTDPPETQPVPEPATLFLSASGLAMIARRRRARRA